MKDLVKKLHPHEKKILLTLKELELATSQEIAEHAKLPISAVHKASLWAKLKGFVKYKEKKVQEISLTPEGIQYAKEGSPEKKLLSIIASGKKTISELRDFPNFNIALGWAKRKGWIKIDGDKIEITREGKKAINISTPVEKALVECKTAKPKVINELKNRNLIKVRTLAQKTFALTEKGKEALPHIKIGGEIGQLTPAIIKSQAWKGKTFQVYDLAMPTPKIWTAKLHPYIQFLLETRKKLIALGFQEVIGPLVELEFWNCDTLFMPQDHPARGIHDIFELKNPEIGKIEDERLLKRVATTHRNGWITNSKGWGFFDPQQTLRLVLRSQTTSVSIRTLAKKLDNTKFFTIDRCFRPDIIDANHLMEFHQCEGIVVGKNLNLKHLLGYLKIFGKEIAGAEDVRFKPAYFPFTEPSVELDCLVNGKWVEVAGSGIFRPEVTQPLGVDGQVLAWGIGFTRLAMIKLGLQDIRDLFSCDLEWLRKRSILL